MKYLQCFTKVSLFLSLSNQVIKFLPVIYIITKVITYQPSDYQIAVYRLKKKNQTGEICFWYTPPISPKTYHYYLTTSHWCPGYYITLFTQNV